MSRLVVFVRREPEPEPEPATEPEVLDFAPLAMEPPTAPEPAPTPVMAVDTTAAQRHAAHMAAMREAAARKRAAKKAEAEAEAARTGTGTGTGTDSPVEVIANVAETPEHPNPQTEADAAPLPEVHEDADA